MRCTWASSHHHDTCSPPLSRYAAAFLETCCVPGCSRGQLGVSLDVVPRGPFASLPGLEQEKPLSKRVSKNDWGSQIVTVHLAKNASSPCTCPVSLGQTRKLRLWEVEICPKPHRWSVWALVWNSPCWIAKPVRFPSSHTHRVPSGGWPAGPPTKVRMSNR